MLNELPIARAISGKGDYGIVDLPTLRLQCGIHEMRFLLQAQNSLHVLDATSNHYRSGYQTPNSSTLLRG